MMRAKILVVDDERDMLTLFKRIITEKTEHEVITQHDPVRAIELMKTEPFQVVFTDLKMPKMDGIAFLEKAKAVQPAGTVIIMTAYGTIETAVEATRKGAFDYISKPFRKERILLTIRKALEWQALRHENVVLRESLQKETSFPRIIGNSPAMTSILKKIQQVAKSTATILIQGESGTGKELIAKAIHAESDRNDTAFVTIDCTAIPEQIIESELFGHKKGSFTGAWIDKKGLVDEAHNGTLFLDEIGELSTAMQAKLLRLLQEGEYKPVGGLQKRRVDVRFIAATNQDLKELVARGEFREDLFYRLNVIGVCLPPLRERREDIPLLVHHLIRKYSKLNSKGVSEIKPDAMAHLMARQWPGNVRELENVIERGIILCSSDRLGMEELLTDAVSSELPTHFDETIFHLPFKAAKETVIQAFHRQYIHALLQANQGNISKAADQAGLQRQYLHRLIKESGIRAEQFKEP